MPLPFWSAGSAEMSSESLMGVPLYVTGCFSLDAFNILSLSFIFAILITVCPSVGAQSSYSLGRTSVILIILLFVGHSPRDMGLNYAISPPLLPISLWFLFYIFSCRRSFLLVFQSFSSIIAL